MSEDGQMDKRLSERLGRALERAPGYEELREEIARKEIRVATAQSRRRLRALITRFESEGASDLALLARAALRRDQHLQKARALAATGRTAHAEYHYARAARLKYKAGL